MAIRNGTARADTLFGTSGEDRLFGGKGNDLIYGGKTSNWYDTDAGDLIDGGAGNDRLYGGYGNDTFIAGTGADEFYGFTGNDTLDYSKAKSGIGLTIGGFAAFNSGSAMNDYAEMVETVIGTRFADTIELAGWNDEGKGALFGGGGDDNLTGGYTADRLVGAAGADTLYGEGGKDRLLGMKGADLLYGGDGEDLLYGGDGADTLYGGDGKDSLYGGAGRDRIKLGGDDIIFGGKGADSFETDYFDFDRVRIKDFDVKSGDRIVLGGSDRYKTFEDVMADATEKRGTTTITFFDDAVLILEGVKKADLSADDFYI